MWPVSVTRVWVQALSVSWKLIEDGFSVGCILYPRLLQLSVRHTQQTLQRNKNRESEKGTKRNWGLWRLKHRTKEIRDINKHTISISHIHIPPDHSIHSLVSWCTGAGRSVWATRRWSDYSCLNSRSRGDTDYIPTQMHTHTCLYMFFLLKCLSKVLMKQ